MSAKKSGKSKTPTPAKKRTRFPRTEAALAGRPPNEAATEPMTDAAPALEAGEAPAAQATTEAPNAEGPGAEATAEGTTSNAETAAAGVDRPKKGRKARAARAADGDGKVRKLSALDAAARLLGEAGQPMGCKEMIAAMAARGYWTSPAGRTPAATLYSSILREVTTKGAQARFVKAERGKFGLRPTTA
jgi:hypothetical protein